MLIEKFREGPDSNQHVCDTTEPLNDDADSDLEQMDVTMSLLCSMDTTIASQGSNQQQRQKEQLWLEQARRDLDVFFRKLASDFPRSQWLREQLAELWQKNMQTFN